MSRVIKLRDQAAPHARADWGNLARPAVAPGGRQRGGAHGGAASEAGAARREAAAAGGGADPAVEAAWREEFERRLAEEREQALAAARAEGLAAGREEGRRQAYAEAREAAAAVLAEVEALRAEAAALRQEALEARAQALDRAREDIVRLAAEMARRIVRRELSLQPEEIVHMLAGLLAEAREQNELTLLVNPGDAVILEGQRGDLQAALRASQKVQIVPDPAVAPGGAVLETPGGTWDARVESQIEVLEAALREAILGGD